MRLYPFVGPGLDRAGAYQSCLLQLFPQPQREGDIGLAPETRIRILG